MSLMRVSNTKRWDILNSRVERLRVNFHESLILFERTEILSVTIEPCSQEQPTHSGFFSRRNRDPFQRLFSSQCVYSAFRIQKPRIPWMRGFLLFGTI